MATTAKSEEDLLREIARMEALIAASQRPAAPVKKPPSYSYSRPGTTYTRPTYTYNNGSIAQPTNKYKFTNSSTQPQAPKPPSRPAPQISAKPQFVPPKHPAQAPRMSPLSARFRSVYQAPNVAPKKKGMLQRRLETMNSVSMNGRMYNASKYKTTMQGVSNNLQLAPLIPTSMKLSDIPSKLPPKASLKYRRKSGSKGTVSIAGSKYRMDPTGKKLVLVNVERASANPSTSPVSGLSTPSKAFVPTRVSIDGVQYIRKADGQALVRTVASRRIAASNKLKAAMERKKKQPTKEKSLCIFFTRFGHCNRGDQCPYLHDKEKVAVCRKFLKGKCTDPQCKLSHRVDKGKMPVCYHFIKDICTNPDCPYLHVKVDPNAEVCQDFLKGYCPRGESCTMKHTYECQHFAKYGVCPAGDKCRLEHRNKREKKSSLADQQRKRKRAEDINDTQVDLDLVVAPYEESMDEDVTETSVDGQAPYASGEAVELPPAKKIKPGFLTDLTM